MNRRALLTTITVAATAVSLAACTSPAEQSSSLRSDSTASIPQIASGEPTAPRSGATTSVSEMIGSGGDLCLDARSALVRDAVQSLGADSNGGRWRVSEASRHRLAAGCDVDWVKVDGSGFGDATYTSRVLVFHDGRFLGTVDPHEYSYTSIAADTPHSVTVRYRWLGADDPFCCPQGGPTTVTASVSNGAIVRDGRFPPKVK